jgi:hypothetical protein
MVTCSYCAALTPAARAVAAYAPGLTGAGYTHVGSAMRMRYFSSGMMQIRYPYHSPSAKWVDFSMVKAPPSSFLKVLMVIDGFGSYYTHDLCCGVFLGDDYFVRPILGQF